MSKKILGAVAVLVLVAAVLVGVGSASAQSVTCANIDSLLASFGVTGAAQIAAAKASLGCGATAAPAYTFTRDLTVGSTGADVTALQTKLGVTPATGYFGAITKAAVVAYQTANGITPAAGYVGPLTRAALNYVAPVVTPGTTPGTTPSTDLEGNAGDITVTSLSTYSNEEVKAGDDSVKVLGLEVEADDESDVDITSMKVELKQTNTADSQKITDYVDSVEIYMGSTKVGSADASDFSESSDIYTKSISLDGAIVRAGAKAKFYVAINAVSSLDSGDINSETFSVDVLSMRFMDGDGVSSTDSTNVTARTVDFTDLATSGDIEVRISENSSNPDSKVIEVDDVSNTSDVLLLAANMKVTGSDITVDSLSFDITPTGANANEMFSEYKLLVDGDEIDSISVGSIASAATGVIQFTDLEDDFEVTDGDTVVIKLVVDVMDTEGNFGNGDSVVASLTNTDLLAASSTIEDENGDDVAAGDRVGSVTGKSQAFYTEGMIVTPGADGNHIAVNPSDTANDAYGTFTINFNVTAMGADVYLDKTVAESSSTSATPAGDNRVLVLKSDGTTSVFGSAVLTTTDADVDKTQTNTYRIPDGSTGSFTISISSDANPDAWINAVLYALEYGTDDSATGSSVYTFDMGVGGSYTTDPVYVTD